MTRRRCRAGDVPRKGDAAEEMFLNVNGRYIVTELGVEIAPGQVSAELGILMLPAPHPNGHLR